MCKMKSAIILKDRVFIPDYDSHSEMLEELKIADTRDNAERLFIRAELSPRDGDVFSDIDTWVFYVDQDIRPDWFVEEVDKARMVEAVKAWAKEHIHIGVNGLKIDSGRNHYIQDCKDVEIINSTVKAWGNSTVEAWGKNTVEAWDNSTVKALDNCAVETWGNSTVKALDNSTVKAWGKSTVEAWGNSTVEAWDNSTVEAWGNSTVEAWDNSTVVKTEYSMFDKARLILSDNATFKDCAAKVIYQSGDWEFRLVKDGKISRGG